MRFFNSILVLFVFILGCSQKQDYHFRELDNLLQNIIVPYKYENYVPNFKAEKREFKFTGLHGIYTDSIWVIMDGSKYVSLYFEQEKPYLDFFASTPDKAPTKLEMPVRHHNATLLGTRITTCVWYDKWAISGDTHQVTFSEGGETLTITEAQKWFPDGKYDRTGESVYKMTFKVHPQLGYVLEMDCSLVTNDSLKNSVEFINFMPPDVVNPWPGRSQFPYTIYSSVDFDGNEGFANNLYAGNISDETKTEWGKGFEVKSGGFIAMVEKNKWSPSLFRKGDLRFVHRTCDAWLDQHNHVLLPQRGADGFFRLNPEFLFVHFPPEVSNHLIENVQLNDFGKREETMIRVGVLEDFENQPQTLTTTQVAMTKGFWEEDFILSDDAYSGKKSLQINAKSKTFLSKPMENFIRYPQIPLDPDSKYKISAWVKTNSPEINAWISAGIYEWTPYEESRIDRYSTKFSTSTNWKKIELEFTTPDYDPMIDVRFMAEGDGFALFDDFEFVKVVN